MAALIETKPAGLEAVLWRMLMWRWIVWAAWFLAFMATSRAFVTLCGYLAGEDSLRFWVEPGTTVMAWSTAMCIMAIGIAVMGICKVLLTRLNGHRRSFLEASS